MKKAILLIGLIFIVALSYSQTASEYFVQAMECYQKEDIEGTIEYMSKAIDIKPISETTLQAYVFRGAMKYKLEDYRGAIDDFNIAVEMYPNDPVVYSLRASAKGQLVQFRGAIDDYDKAIALDPSNGKYFYKRGLDKLLLLDKVNGCKDLRKALELGEDVEVDLESMCK